MSEFKVLTGKISELISSQEVRVKAWRIILTSNINDNLLVLRSIKYQDLRTDCWPRFNLSASLEMTCGQNVETPSRLRIANQDYQYKPVAIRLLGWHRSHKFFKECPSNGEFKVSGYKPRDH